MKTTPAILLLFLATVAVFTRCQAQGNTDRSYCCPGYTKQPAPLRILKAFHYTDSSCSLPAIVLISKGDRKICGDPSSPWVQQRMVRLPQQ